MRATSYYRSNDTSCSYVTGTCDDVLSPALVSFSKFQILKSVLAKQYLTTVLVGHGWLLFFGSHALYLASSNPAVGFLHKTGTFALCGSSQRKLQSSIFNVLINVDDVTIWKLQSSICID